MTGSYAGFILAAYAAASLVVLALVLWVILDFKAQNKSITDLEAKGIRRRSAGTPSGSDTRERHS